MTRKNKELHIVTGIRLGKDSCPYLKTSDGVEHHVIVGYYPCPDNVAPASWYAANEAAKMLEAGKYSGMLQSDGIDAFHMILSKQQWEKLNQVIDRSRESFHAFMSQVFDAGIFVMKKRRAGKGKSNYIKELCNEGHIHRKRVRK
jgi:hypothetical protein